MASKRTDNFHKNLIKKIAKNKEIDERVADLVATFHLLFTSRVMRDVNDERPIMHRYWGKYAIVKGRKKK